MTPDNFVAHICTAIVDHNDEIYRELFSTTTLESATDPYWKRALILFDSLSATQKDVFLEVIRQVVIDTTSNLLGVVDGAVSLGVPNVDFELVAKTRGYKPEKLNGDLQSLFLSQSHDKV